MEDYLDLLGKTVRLLCPGKERNMFGRIIAVSKILEGGWVFTVRVYGFDKVSGITLARKEFEIIEESGE